MSKRDPLLEVQECLDEARKAFENTHRLMERERRFSDGEHYLDANQDIDLARIRPITEALARVIDFKAGRMTGGPLYFEARPFDPDPDPNSPDDVALSEAGRWLVETNIANPCNRYNATRYRMAYAGQAFRMGIAALDFHHDVGTRGEALWSIVPSNSVMWAPGWLDMHDPTCPWAIEIQAVPLDATMRKKGWKNKDKLQADDGVRVVKEVGDTSRPISEGLAGFESLGKPGETVTIVKLWKRFDSSPKLREKEIDRLPPELQYMMCGMANVDGSVSGGCGYKTPSTWESGEEWPVFSQREIGFNGMPTGGCPTCGGDMVRIEGAVRGEMVTSYGRGKLIIAAPFSQTVCYEGKWPYRLRSFPYWVHRPQLRPHIAVGPSETSRKWSLQALDDASLRMGYEQMNRNRDLTLMPRVGLEDAGGNTFDWLTSDGPAFYTADAPLGPNSVVHYQGSGLNPAFVQWRNMLRQTFREDEGTNDLSPSMGEGGPKDITATTMEIYAESGNVPLDTQKRTWQEDESLALGLTLDLMIEAYDEDRMRELRGEEGPMVLAMLRQRSAHIQVLDQPSLARLDGQKLDGLAKWYSLPPALRKVAARRMNISPADVREVEQAEQQMMMQQQAAAAGAGPVAPDAPTAVGNAGGF